MTDIDLDEFIPHRDRMRLIDAVLEVNAEKATTESIATSNWPLVEGDSVQSLIIIELVAQTASVCVGWKKKTEDASSASGRGWLVGIKNATLLQDKIPLGSRIITRVKTDFSFDNYTGIIGTAETATELIGEVYLQVMQSETDSVLKP